MAGTTHAFLNWYGERSEQIFKVGVWGRFKPPRPLAGVLGAELPSKFLGLLKALKWLIEQGNLKRLSILY